MALYKSEGNWTSVPNSILQSDSITMAEKGMWAYLNSKPDGWDFAIERIAKEVAEKRDSVRRLLVKMEESGILERKRNFARGMDYFLLVPDDGNAHIRSTEICNIGNSRTVSNKEAIVRQSNSLKNKQKENPEANMQTIDDRKEQFAKEVHSKWLKLGADAYITAEQLQRFIDYWTEHGPKQKKFRAESQKFFDYGKRLSTWRSNNLSRNFQNNKPSYQPDLMSEDSLYE